MVNDLSANNTMNILKELITYIDFNVPVSFMNKEFKYLVEGANELIDIYYNESNEIRSHYNNILDDKIVLKNSISLLKELIKYFEEIKNTLPENINNIISNIIQMTDLYYASNN